MTSIKEALTEIKGMCQHLRQGGPDPMDLQELSNAVERATDLAHAALAQLSSTNARILKSINDLKVASDRLHLPPSIQSQRNIFAMNAMDEARVILSTGLLPDASPGNGAERVREALDEIETIVLGGWSNSYDQDFGTKDDDYKFDCILEQVRKAKAALHSTSAAGETTSSDGGVEGHATATIGVSADRKVDATSCSIQEGGHGAQAGIKPGPSEAIPADAGKRISQLAADLVVSGWMAGDHGIERAKKEAEDKLLAFACDEIERHMKQRAVPADVLAMKEACKRVALDYASRMIGKKSKHPDTFAIDAGRLDAANDIAAAIDKLSPGVKAEGGRGGPVAYLDIEGRERPILADALAELRKHPSSGFYADRFVTPLYTHPASPPDVEAIRADERERCAADVERRNWPTVVDARRIASAIRAGGQK